MRAIKTSISVEPEMLARIKSEVLRLGMERDEAMSVSEYLRIAAEEKMARDHNHKRGDR